MGIAALPEMPPWPDHGPYTQITPFARGGMAELWLARQRGVGGLQKQVVLKRALPEHAADPEYQQMFLREARIAASLDHPNVARVYDSGVAADGRSFLAMEHVAGVDLRALLRAHRGEPLPLSITLTIAVGLSQGLSYVHSRRDLDGRHLGLVHRDVSPSNVLLSYDGAVKLTDFGVARADVESLATRSGAIKGKLAYMAPEQARGEGLDPRADLFALGVILFEMLVGRRPFGPMQDVALLYRILEEDAPAPTDLRPDVPSALSDVVVGLLARDRDARTADAATVRAALEAFAGTSGQVLSGARLGEYVAQRCAPTTPSLIAAPAVTEGLEKVQSVVTAPDTAPPRRRQWGLAAAVAGTLGVGLMGAGWSWSQRAEPAPAESSGTEVAPEPAAPPEPEHKPETEPPPEPERDAVEILEPTAPAADSPTEPRPAKKSSRRRRSKKRAAKKRPLDSPLPFGT
ncbi:MAG: serine/threonine-protein kinase [Myxococcota bacterium]